MKTKGIIAINKPKDWTSFDVVNKIKYKLKPLKIGHLGTLDPMATGVLLVTVGKATKLFDIMQEKVKTYIAEFEFGYETDTLDATGTKTRETTVFPTLNEIKSIINDFIGKISQIPPKYSAKSINGVRAYELARNNVEFEIKPKQVEIYEINIITFEGNVLKLEIKCGSGTYIRSVGRDLAYKLNTLATMTSLIRTQVGSVNLNQTIPISKETTTEELQQSIIDVSKLLQFKELHLSDELNSKMLNGQTVQIEREDGNYCLINDNSVSAIVKIENNKAKMSIFLD